MTSTELALSIVVPAFNEASRLPESLRRIQSACGAIANLKYELIVCDNNSTDGTAAMFLVLHKHPFRTSGRRAMSYNALSWMIFGLKLTFFHSRSIRDRGFAEKWYDAGR